MKRVIAVVGLMSMLACKASFMDSAVLEDNSKILRSKVQTRFMEELGGELELAAKGKCSTVIPAGKEIKVVNVEKEGFYLVVTLENPEPCSGQKTMTRGYVLAQDVMIDGQSEADPVASSEPAVSPTKAPIAGPTQSPVVIKPDMDKYPNPNVEAKQDVLVLMYHDIVASNPVGSDVGLAEFTAQMNLLVKNGYSTVSTEEFRNHLTQGTKLPGKKNVLLTFDDGYIGNYDNALPVLRKNKMKAAFFVHTDYVGVKTTKDHLNWAQLREVDADPMYSVESHTKSHPCPPMGLAQIDATKLRTELKVADEKLESMLGRPIDFIAYPCGSYNSNVIQESRYYYKLGFAVAKTDSAPLNLFNIPRVGVGAEVTLEVFRTSLMSRFL